MLKDTKSGMNSNVNGYFRKAKKWREEMALLREILLDCQLTEELKWGKPTYTLDGKIVVLIVGFKNYCALLFSKGALLADPNGILVKPTENTQATRQIRFTEKREIVELDAVLKAYVDEAIAVESAGLKVALKKITEFQLPDELIDIFDGTPALKKAFEALTPGRQRAYILHFSAPKQSKTRQSRIEKCIPRIQNGKGINDE